MVRATPRERAFLSFIACAHPEPRQRTLFHARDYISGDRFAVVKCQQCGVARTLPVPSAGRLDRYYPKSYYGESTRYRAPLERLLDRLYAHRAREIEKITGIQHGRVLDVGCGRGSLLHHLQRRGWTVTGTELSDESARFARDVYHLEILSGNVLELELPGRFDLIVLWHVLEHVTHPAALLHKLSEALEPGGTLLVAVPNFGSIEARLGRAGWFHLDVPRHLQHFTIRSLRRLLRAEALRPYTVRYVAVEYDFFSFVQTVLNALGLRHNLLYDLIRTRGAKMLAAGDSDMRRQTLLTALLAPPLAALSPIWVVLVAALRTSATVTIYARKG